MSADGSSEMMKAIVQLNYGSPDVLQLRDVDTPVVKDDEVLVRVHAAAVNIGDWHLLRGVPYAMRLVSGLFKPKREIPGVDVVGEVELTGTNVEHFRPGDEVFGWCRGAFAEYACALETNLLPKPANLTFEQAAAIGDSAATALAAVRDHGKVQSGQTVLIIGASGGVGTFAVQIAKALGANVTGVCSTKNVDMVRSIGAVQVIDYTKEDFTQAGQRYDVMLDLVGSSSLSDCRRALKPRGHLRRGRRQGHGPLVRTRASDQGALAIAIRAPADACVRRETQQRGPRCSEGTRRSRKGHAGHR
jgi:NADPH:quinone reductase-like Zn-dependent oxidoreductase